MRLQEFIKLTNKMLNICKETLLSKSKEYSTEDDKLHNFKEAARRGKTPEQALLGMDMKHRVSIEDLVDDTKGLSPEQFLDKWSPAKVEEKIKDSINYLLLLNALIDERTKLYYNKMEVGCKSSTSPTEP